MQIELVTADNGQRQQCVNHNVDDRIMVRNKGAGTIGAVEQRNDNSGDLSYHVYFDDQLERRHVEVRPEDVEGEAWDATECRKFKNIVKRLAEDINKTGNQKEVKALLCNEVIQIDRSFAYIDDDDLVLDLLEDEKIDGKALFKLSKEDYENLCKRLVGDTCASSPTAANSPGTQHTFGQSATGSKKSFDRVFKRKSSLNNFSSQSTQHSTTGREHGEMRQKAITVIWKAIEAIQKRHQPYRFYRHQTEMYKTFWAGLGDPSTDDEDGFNQQNEESDDDDDFDDAGLEHEEVPSEQVEFDQGEKHPRPILGGSENDGPLLPPVNATFRGHVRLVLEIKNEGEILVLEGPLPSNYELPRTLIELDVRRYGVFYFAYVVNQLTIRSNDSLWLLLDYLALRMETCVVIRLINYFIQIFSRFDPDDCKVLYMCKAIVSGSKHPIGTSLLMAAFMEELGNLDRQSRDMYVGGKEEDLEKKIGCGNFQEFFIEGASELLEAIESDHLALMTLECPTDIVGGKSMFSAFDIAIKFKLSEFMASSRIQRVTNTIWTNRNPLDPNSTFRTKDINCCDYGVGLFNCKHQSERQQGPFKWFVTPYGKYITEILSYLAFVFFFLMSTIMRRSIYDEFDYLEGILMTCIFSFTIKEIWDLQGDMRAYCTNIQNWTDMLIIVTFAIIFSLKMEERFEWTGPTECDDTCARFCSGASTSTPYVDYPFNERHTFPDVLPEGAYADGAKIYDNENNRNPIVTFYDGNLADDKVTKVDLMHDGVAFPIYYARWGTLYSGFTSDTVKGAGQDQIGELLNQAKHMKMYTELFHPQYYDSSTGKRREGQDKKVDIELYGQATVKNHCDDEDDGLCNKPDRLPCNAYTKQHADVDYEQYCPANNMYHEDDGSADYGPEPVGWFFKGKFLRYTDCSIAHKDHEFCKDKRTSFNADLQGKCQFPVAVGWGVMMETWGRAIKSCGHGVWHYHEVDCQSMISSGRSMNYKAVWSLVILFHVWRVLFFLRIFDAMGRFHKICIYMLKPLVIFFVFLMLISMGFSVVFFYIAGDTAVQQFYRFGDAWWWTMMAVQGDMDVEPVLADNAWDYGDQERVGIYTALHRLAEHTQGVEPADFPFGEEGPPELQNIDETRSMYVRTLMYLFLCVGCVMLLNLLIAVMATVYEEFQDDAYNELQFERGKRAIHMDKESGMLPAPFNILPIAALIVWNVLELFLILCSWYVDLVPFGKYFKHHKAVSEIKRSTLRGSSDDMLSDRTHELSGEECCTCFLPLGFQLKRGPPHNGDSSCCGRVKGAFKMVWLSGGEKDTWWCVYCNSYVDPQERRGGVPTTQKREFYNKILEDYYQKYEEDMAPLDSGDKQNLTEKRPELCPACYRNKATQTRFGVQTEIVSFCSFMLVLYIPFLALLFPLWLLFRFQRMFTKSRFKATMTSEIGDTRSKLVMPHSTEVERDFSKDDKYIRLMKGPYSHHHIWRCSQKNLGIRLRFEDTEKAWENRERAISTHKREKFEFRHHFGFKLTETKLQVVYIYPEGAKNRNVQVMSYGRPLPSRSIADAGVQKGDRIIEFVCRRKRILVHNKHHEDEVLNLLRCHDMSRDGPVELVFSSQGQLAIRDQKVEDALGKELTATTAKFDAETKDWFKAQLKKQLDDHMHAAAEEAARSGRLTQLHGHGRTSSRASFFLNVPPRSRARSISGPARTETQRSQTRTLEKIEKSVASLRDQVVETQEACRELMAKMDHIVEMGREPTGSRSQRPIAEGEEEAGAEAPNGSTEI